ncbi:MAG: hypothetical protein KJ760_05920, partial [Proteobacteria bacterium]|nr:hypothetical protein [Pseudomonadota bacterium]
MLNGKCIQHIKIILLFGKKLNYLNDINRRIQMRKYIIMSMGLFMIMAFSNSAYAVVTTSTGGADVVITDSGSGPGFTFTPSPSTVMSSIGTATAFCISSGSTKTTATNGLEFRLLSDDSTIYQKQGTGVTAAVI